VSPDRRDTVRRPAAAVGSAVAVVLLTGSCGVSPQEHPERVPIQELPSPLDGVRPGHPLVHDRTT
jgi:hypothetical protein